MTIKQPGGQSLLLEISGRHAACLASYPQEGKEGR